MDKKIFLNYFPVPDFLRMPATGLDISDEQIRFVELVNNYGKKELGKFGKVDLPSGAVVDGEVKDKNELVKILRDIKEKNSLDFVRMSIAETKSYIFKTTIPRTENMSDEEILAELSFKVEENVPLSLDDVVFDFDILCFNQNFLEAVVSVTHKKTIKQFMEVCEEVGLFPLSFEVDAQSVARAVIAKGDKETFMIVNFGNSKTSISIVSGGLVQFASTIEVGDKDLVLAIKKRLNSSLKEAEKLKKEKGLVRENSKDELFFSLLNVASVLKEEINKYLIYWNSRSKKEKTRIQKIILCGSGASTKGLDDYLSFSVGLEVKKADVWKNSFSLKDFVPDICFDESLGYSSAIGLVLKS